MTTEPKYYSPSIEEFHVGFWYEHRGSEHEEWAGMIVTTAEDLDALALEIKSGDIRVKLLDREDIEAEGMKLSYALFIQACFDIGDPYKTGGGFLHLNSSGEVSISLNFGHHEIDGTPKAETVFSGTIRNRSELKRILKQVGIKK